MTHLLLLRHGSTDLTRSHLIGRTPGIALSQQGREEVKAMASRLRGVHALFTSPVQRAAETASIIRDVIGISPVIEEDLAEFDFGRWTGKAFAELQTEPEWKRFNESRETTRAPDGESMADVQRRANAVVRRLVRDHPESGTLALVSHGDVIRSLLLSAAGTSINNYWRFTVDVASICEIGVEGDTPRILRANDCAHLERFAM